MNLDLQQILTQIFGFLLLLWLLKLFAWKPILKILDERKERIGQGLKQIEEAQQELSRLKEEYQAKLKRIDQEAHLRMQEAIAESHQISTEIQEEARAEAKKILEKAQSTIIMEVAKAKVSLKEEIVNLALTATEKLIKHKLDQEKDKELVDQFIQELENLK
jgi:F-type H+-transporting ATPase subunit b